MANEIASFWDRLECFLLSDDKARWKAIRWIIFVVGTCGSFDLVVLDSPIQDAIPLMGALALLLSILWLAWYGSFRPIKQYQSIEAFRSRRRLVLQATASTIGAFIAFWLGQRPARALNAELSRATNTNDYSAAIDVFERAKANRVHLDKALFKKATQQFTRESNQPIAWRATLAIADYKSFLNGQIAARLPRGENISYTMYLNAVPPGGRNPRIFAAGNVPKAEAAALEPLDNPLNTTDSRAYQWITVQDGDSALENLHAKNVIFRDVRIRYYGGPIKLENVYFVNCEFHIRENSDCFNFARSVGISVSSVNFTIPFGQAPSKSAPTNPLPPIVSD